MEGSIRCTQPSHVPLKALHLQVAGISQSFVLIIQTGSENSVSRQASTKHKTSELHPSAAILQMPHSSRMQLSRSSRVKQSTVSSCRVQQSTVSSYRVQQSTVSSYIPRSVAEYRLAKSALSALHVIMV